MRFLFLLPSLFIFFYILYKLVKDDYIFIRKNISLEQVFDIAFFILLISLLSSRFFFFIFHQGIDNSIFMQFFSLQKEGFSLIGAVFGAIPALYLIGKYKKAPLGRLFDFFSYSFLLALPIGFISQIPFAKQNEMPLYVLNAVLYLFFILYFAKFLYPKVLNRTLTEGNLSILFLIFFSLTSLFTSVISSGKDHPFYLNPQNIILGVSILFYVLLLFKQERSRVKGRRTLTNQ